MVARLMSYLLDLLHLNEESKQVSRVVYDP